MLARDPGSDKMLALFTTDTSNDTEAIAARYAHRWPIETAIAAGKQLLGIVARTVNLDDTYRRRFQ